MEKFDLIVVGSGPAGYTGAIRAAQLGMKVAVLEKADTLGGTCLNVGCIPSKALLHYSAKYEDALKNFSDIGIKTELFLELSTMMKRKAEVVNTLCKGIEGLFAKNKITHFKGWAKIISSDEILLTKNNGEKQNLKSKNILITTGSVVSNLPGVDIDEKIILSSTGALSLTNVPPNLAVIGAGYIGLELGSVWRRLGSKVTVIEYSDFILPNMDREVAEKLFKALQNQGMEFLLNHKVISINKKDNVAQLVVQHDQNQKNIQVDAVLVAVGRKPNTENLGLDDLKIKINDRNQIIVNDKYQTNIPNIYAAGDVIPGPMLAHKAEEESIAAVENMVGKFGHVDYRCIPSVIYTLPEVASVGATEEELKNNNIDYKIGKFPFAANGKAIVMGETYGMVKILADKITDEVLGAHIIGHDAGNMISEITTIMAYKGSADDIAMICHPHPTISETIKEAALNISNRAINF